MNVPESFKFLDTLQSKPVFLLAKPVSPSLCMCLHGNTMISVFKLEFMWKILITVCPSPTLYAFYLYECTLQGISALLTSVTASQILMKLFMDGEYQDILCLSLAVSCFTVQLVIYLEFAEILISVWRETFIFSSTYL